MQDVRTLYERQTERDACGIGMLCRIDGTPQHYIMRKGLSILLELDYRGECGCDDAAGMLMQVRHRFLPLRCPTFQSPGTTV